MRDLTIYTDGSVYPNPGGIGGWAYVCLDYDGHGENSEYGSWARNTTNNRMELTAAINALQLGERGALITIVTDSQYVQRCFARRAWPESKPNADLGRMLMDFKRGRFIEVKLVAGHSGDQWNDRAHELANKFRLEGVEFEKRAKEEFERRPQATELRFTVQPSRQWRSGTTTAPQPVPTSTTTHTLWERATMSRVSAPVPYQVLEF